MSDDAPAQTPRPDPMTLAYAQGDFARLRKLAAAELAKPREEQDRERASEARVWLARLSVDVSVYLVLGFAALLFCAIVLRYVAT